MRISKKKFYTDIIKLKAKKTVSISVDTSNDPDLQDIIEMLNSNRNKKRKFKPKIPATRNIKQRLNMITQSILNILTVQP